MKVTILKVIPIIGGSKEFFPIETGTLEIKGRVLTNSTVPIEYASIPNGSHYAIKKRSKYEDGYNHSNTVLTLYNKYGDPCSKLECRLKEYYIQWLLFLQWINTPKNKDTIILSAIFTILGSVLTFWLTSCPNP